MSDIDHARSLLGKQVKVTLEYENRDGSATIAVGQLLGFGDGGDFEILEDDGFVHYGWPMLHVEEVKPSQHAFKPGTSVDGGPPSELWCDLCGESRSKAHP